MDLLHTYSEDDLRRGFIFEKLFLYLKSDRLEIRELAYWHLRQLDPVGAKEIGAFDANNPDANKLARWQISWKKRFDAKREIVHRLSFRVRRLPARVQVEPLWISHARETVEVMAFPLPRNAIHV